MDDKENQGLKLLRKGQKGIIHAVFSRTGLIFLLLFINFGILFGVFHWFYGLLPHFYGLSILFTICVVMYLINNTMDSTVKVTWLILIMLMPILGALLLLYTRTEIGHRAVKERLNQLTKETKTSIVQKEETVQSLQKESPETAALAHYIGRTGCFPVFDQTEVTYFPLGEDKFAELLIQLEKAEHFIFLEYFIIDEGYMWGKVLDILARKAKEGVEVRVMYDGTCEFSLLPHDYPKRLSALGISCKMFSPIQPFVSTHYNYRDHRKILVIDGHTAFTGGVNLADEYINRVQRFGHWKDTAIMLKGEAVKSFTLMFLQMWNMDVKKPEIDKYLQEIEIPQVKTEGYVIPYGDCPLDQDKVGERVYMDILNHSEKYVHIMTPYLILDDELKTALKFAAERGIDVKLILPGIPDKKIPYALAKTQYVTLLNSGVKIYEYTPGFVHAKVFVSDDCKAVVGTINMDYRSLYHHFECATYMYKSDCIPAIERDFQDTLSKCRQISMETVKAEKWTTKLVGCVMKVMAPLL